MKVFTAQFDGYWHGGIAVVVAQDKHEAAGLLEDKLVRYSKSPSPGSLAQEIDPDDLVEVDLKRKGVDILDDGDE